MENRIRKFVYNNDYIYTSYGSIKCLIICVCWFMTLIIGTYAIIAKLWSFIAILLFINCAFLLHLFLLKFFFKQSYTLRFLSDGIVDTCLSALFLTLAYMVLCATNCDTDFVKYGTLITYVVFVILYIVLMVGSSKSDKYHQQGQSREVKKSLLFIGSLIPLSGIIGIVAARIIFGVFDFKNQVAVYVAFVAFTFISLFFSLGSVNFIKYYYCKKYNINCDSEGKNCSPGLEPPTKDKNRKAVNSHKEQHNATEAIQSKKKRFIKIICIIASIPIIVFLLLLLLGFLQSVLR